MSEEKKEKGFLENLVTLLLSMVTLAFIAASMGLVLGLGIAAFVGTYRTFLEYLQ